MTKYQKLLIGAVIALLMANLVLLGFIWRNRPVDRPPVAKEYRRDRTARFFQKELDLDAGQYHIFQNLQEEHRKRMKRFNRDMRTLNRNLHEAIINQEAEKETLIGKQIDSVHLLMKKQTTNYVRSLSDLCTEEQKEKLLKVFNELPDRQGHRGRRSRNRH